MNMKAQKLQQRHIESESVHTLSKKVLGISFADFLTEDTIFFVLIYFQCRIVTPHSISHVCSFYVWSCFVIVQVFQLMKFQPRLKKIIPLLKQSYFVILMFQFFLQCFNVILNFIFKLQRALLHVLYQCLHCYPFVFRYFKGIDY